MALSTLLMTTTRTTGGYLLSSERRSEYAMLHRPYHSLGPIHHTQVSVFYIGLSGGTWVEGPRVVDVRASFPTKSISTHIEL